MINIFQKKYLDLFTECGYGVNCISDIIQGIGYDLFTMSSYQAKIDALDVIKQLLSYDIIYVLHWGKDDSALKDKNIGINETMNTIKSQWFLGADYIDFSNMTTFFYTEWYLEKLKELKIDEKTDWEWFSNEIIPKIKEWAEGK